MQRFNKVPLTDINLLLKKYGQDIPINIHERYMTAYNYIINNPEIDLPQSIEDYFIAQNSNVGRRYSSTEILLSNDEVLPNIDKERTLRILGYMDKLDNDLNVFNLLPDDALNVLLSKLDCKTIILMCKLLGNRCNLKRLLQESLSKDETYTEEHLVNICRSLNNVEKDKVGRLDLTKYFIIGKDDTVYIVENNTYMKTGATNIIKIFANDKNDCAFFLRSDGKVYVYGNNESKKLGVPDRIVKEPKLLSEIDNIKSVSQTRYITFLLRNDGRVYLMGTISDEIILENPTLIDDIKDIVQISSNEESAIFLDKNGGVYGYGKNSNNELAQRNFEGIKLLFKNYGTKQIQLTSECIFILMNNGNLYVRSKEIKTFTQFRYLKNVKQIVSGPNFTLALTYERKLYAILTKVNIPGQMKDIINIYKISVDNILDFSLDYNGVYILTNDEDIYMWGFFGNLYLLYSDVKKLGSFKNIQLLGYNVIRDKNGLFILDNTGEFKLRKINI